MNMYLFVFLINLPQHKNYLNQKIQMKKILFASIIISILGFGCTRKFDIHRYSEPNGRFNK
jgi:hypothetical protein